MYFLNLKFVGSARKQFFIIIEGVFCPKLMFAPYLLRISVMIKASGHPSNCLRVVVWCKYDIFPVKSFLCLLIIIIMLNHKTVIKFKRI